VDRDRPRVDPDDGGPLDLLPQHEGPLGPDPWESHEGRVARRLVVVAALAAWMAASGWVVAMVSGRYSEWISAEPRPEDTYLSIALLMLALLALPLISAAGVSLGSGRARVPGDVVALTAAAAASALGFAAFRGTLLTVIGFASKGGVPGRAWAGAYLIASLAATVGALTRLVMGGKTPLESD
jgi:hypothetical protein